MIEGKKLIIIMLAIVIAIGVGAYLLYLLGPRGTLPEGDSFAPHANIETLTPAPAVLIS